MQRRIVFMGANGFPSETFSIHIIHHSFSSNLMSPLPLLILGRVYQPIFQILQQKLQQQEILKSQNLPLVQGIDIYEQALHCQNWIGMRDKIIQQIEQQQQQQQQRKEPVIGIGHSVGRESRFITTTLH
jgi:hypothetical protein